MGIATKLLNATEADVEKALGRVRYDHGCWQWTGALDRGGYGVMRMAGGRIAKVHRLMYEALVGPLGALHVDHRCRNTACCNPLHLDPVTHAVNVARSTSGQRQRAVTQCPQGHEYTAANTRIRQPYSRRECRECGRDYQREYAREHRKAAA